MDDPLPFPLSVPRRPVYSFWGPLPAKTLRFMRPEVNATEVAIEIDLATGEVTLAEGMEPDEAARLFWDAVRRLAPTSPT